MLRLIAMPLIAAALLAACGDAPGGLGTGPAPAASVGETEITDDELAQQAKLFSFLATLGQQQCGGAPADGETQEAVCNRFTLGNMIQSVFIESYAAANDISAKPAELDGIIANLDQQLTAATVDAELGKLGLTRTDLRGFAEQVLLFQGVQAAVVEQELDIDDLRTTYDDQILSFTTIEALHILVETEAQAQDVYQQVTAPGATRKTFEALAKQVSTDGSAAQGGSLGEAPAANYVPEFSGAAVALQPGGISQPVQSEFGWHVIYLVDKQVIPFDEAKASLLQGDQSGVFTTWIREQAESEGVEVNPRYGRFDPETLAVVSVSSTDPSANAGPSDGATNDGDEGTPAP